MTSYLGRADAFCYALPPPLFRSSTVPTMAGHKRPHSSLDTSSPISRPCTARLSLENTTNLLASLPLPLEHFTKLTESITAAHAIVAVKEEELDRARKLVRLQGSSKGSGTKKEEEEGAKVSLTGEEGCWTDVVGIAGGAVHEVLEDLRASRAQLDALVSILGVRARSSPLSVTDVDVAAGHHGSTFGRWDRSTGGSAEVAGSHSRARQHRMAGGSVQVRAHVSLW